MNTSNNLKFVPLLKVEQLVPGHFLFFGKWGIHSGSLANRIYEGQINNLKAILLKVHPKRIWGEKNYTVYINIFCKGKIYITFIQKNEFDGRVKISV